MQSRRDTMNSSTRAPALPVPSREDIAASRASFCRYLINARESRGLSLEDIAAKTRIPPRSLELLEAGEFEKLPADVFVRGFLRSYARCVGLDTDETIGRYAECGMTPAPVSSPMAASLAGSMASLDSSGSAAYRVRPATSQVVDHGADQIAEAMDDRLDGQDGPIAGGTGAVPALEAASSANRDVSQLVAIPAATSAPVAAVATLEAASDSIASVPSSKPAVSAAEHTDAVPEPVTRTEHSSAQRSLAVIAAKTVAAQASVGKTTDELSRTARKRNKRKRRKQQRTGVHVDMRRAGDAGDACEPLPQSEPRSYESTHPALPVEPSAAHESVAIPLPVRAVGSAPVPASKKTLPRPQLLIDDDHPEEAERAQEERATAEREDPSWRQFLPPSLLDHEQGSRRGALTLAVIILVIVATLTMSYLLRRPSYSGDGVTQGLSTPDSAVAGAEGSVVREG